MSTFGGVYFTNKGRALQAKALTGVQLNFTRIGVGDGSLSGQAIQDLNALINEVKSISITKLKNTNDGTATIGGSFSNQGLSTGFYYRELGLFAQDPTLGEILYCYGNAGALAEYIPADGGSDILEKQINIVAIVGDAPSVSATLNSLIQVSSVNGQSGDVVLAAGDVGAVPATRKVNNKALSADITLSASDILMSSGESIETSWTDIVQQQTEITTYSVYKLNVDVNDIYTEIQHKRPDGTLISKSVLSGGTSPNYTTRTVTEYATNGTTVESTKVYTLSYDANGNLISEVLA